MNIRKINFILLFSFIFLVSCKIEKFKQGKELYTRHCASCHMEDGTGLAALIPPLAKADYYENNLSNIVCIIIRGLEGPIEVNTVKFDQKMEAIKPISSVEITNIINYINHSWGNDYGTITLSEVESQMYQCK